MLKYLDWENALGEHESENTKLMRKSKKIVTVTNDKVFLTLSCNICQFAKSFLVKAYFLNLNICQDLPIRTILYFLQGNDA